MQLNACKGKPYEQVHCIGGFRDVHHRFCGRAGLGTQPGSGKVYEGMVNIVGTVDQTQNGFALKTAEGTYRLAGADASKLVGKKVKAWGTVTMDEATNVQTLKVYTFKKAK